MIYADNAATTKLDIDAFEAMKPYLLAEYGNASQPYSFSRTTKSALRNARIIIAECINALPEEIYFTSGGTESDNWSIKGTALYGGNKLATITSSIEHHAVLNSCAAIERLGYPVIYLPVSRDGIVQQSQLQDILTNQTRLVSIMLANNEIGSIQPIRDLCVITHKHGAIFHTDAVQALGHIKVDVSELGVDMLSASAHKFNGPKGIGFLYIKKGTSIIPYEDGGSQEAGFRAGTENVASVVGMAVALKKNCENIDSNLANQKMLEDRLVSALTDCGLDFIRNGSTNHIPGNVSLSFRDIDGELLLHRLDLMGVCVSTGSACDSGNIQISHVLKAINLPLEYAKGTIRVSLGRNNTVEEVEYIGNALKKIISKNKK